MENSFSDRLYILDGGMGTMLQKAGAGAGENTARFAVTHPEILKDIHRQYVEAGSDIILAATFGVSRFKEKELGMSAKEVIKKALDVAVAVKEEAAESGREVRVALDVSNLGELVEPMGTLSFEDAYDEYAEIVRAGAENGADIIMIETMTDLYDTKAAVLAAKENTRCV